MITGTRLAKESPSVDRFLRFLLDNLHTTIAPAGASHGQSVDLANAYLDRCWDMPPISGHAITWQHAMLPGWRWIPADPLRMPYLGDLVLWADTPHYGIGAGGHVAIAIDASFGPLLVYEQDWPGIPTCEFADHSFLGVVGWLRSPSP